MDSRSLEEEEEDEVEVDEEEDEEEEEEHGEEEAVQEEESPHPLAHNKIQVRHFFVSFCAGVTYRVPNQFPF